MSVKDFFEKRKTKKSYFLFELLTVTTNLLPNCHPNIFFTEKNFEDIFF
jgi:hypothetical protein